MAINKNELRLGNYLMYQGLYPVYVDSIGDYGFTCRGDEVFPPDNFDIEPIPLTEELVLSHGFVKDDDVYVNHRIVIYKNRLLGTDEFDGFYCELQMRHPFETNFVHLQYFHQLQNLYFMLVGNELLIGELEKI